MVSAKTVSDSLGNLKDDINKTRKNLRLLAYSQEKLEQYTRRDNLRLFNFPACKDGQLRGKFVALATLLGVQISETDINIIHQLPSRTPSKHVIVRLNNRHIRNQILYAKKAVLNEEGCPFKWVYIQEDLTIQRSKLFRSLKNDANTEWVKTREGKIHVSLKDDKGSGKKVVIDNPDDLFMVGIDINDADIIQFGFQDI